MRPLDVIERALEGVIERLFAGGRTPLQPLEIARGLRRAMEDSLRTGPERSYVANHYEVALAPDDRRELAPLEPVVLGELAGYLDELARDQGYALSGRPQVQFVESEDLKRGSFRVTAALVAVPEEAWVQLLTGPEAGRVWDLPQETVLGRGGSAEIVLADPSVSRDHARIVCREGSYYIVDLGSTNGTWVQGQRVAPEAPLSDGDVIKLGAVELLFRARLGH